MPNNQGGARNVKLIKNKNKNKNKVAGHKYEIRKLWKTNKDDGKHPLRERR